MKFFLIFISLVFSLMGENTESSSKKIVFLGDSLTAGYGVSKSKAYPELVERHLKEEGQPVEVINAGVSGSTSASAVSRLKWLLKGQPDIVVLALGANDGLRGVEPSATKKNLLEVIQLAQNNDIKVVLAGMKVPKNYGKEYGQNYEKIFKELAEEKNLAFIPFLLKGVAGERELNQSDGIHPNEEGHKKIAKTVISELKEHL